MKARLMILPTFIIGGAARSGTTYVYEFLDSHPQVYMAKPARPEPKFYAFDDEFVKGLPYYSTRYFEPAVGHIAIGEKSTVYLESAHAAKRIRLSQEDVRL